MTPEDSNRYVNHKSVKYHDTLECMVIQKPEDYATRSLRYVEVRDLGPCQYCHSQLQNPGGDNDPDWGAQNALKEAASDDGD